MDTSERWKPQTRPEPTLELAYRAHPRTGIKDLLGEIDEKVRRCELLPETDAEHAELLAHIGSRLRAFFFKIRVSAAGTGSVAAVPVISGDDNKHAVIGCEIVSSPGFSPSATEGTAQLREIIRAHSNFFAKYFPPAQLSRWTSEASDLVKQIDRI